MFEVGCRADSSFSLDISNGMLPRQTLPALLSDTALLRGRSRLPSGDKSSMICPNLKVQFWRGV